VDRNMKNVSPFPQATSMDKPAQLDRSERLFLWGFRSIAQHRNCGCPVLAATKHVYQRFQIEDAVTPLDALIDVFALNIHSAIEIHGPNCPCLAESEAALLRAMASAQSARLIGVRRGLERWLPEPAADQALGLLCEIAGIFQAAGLTFEPRNSRTSDADETAMVRSLMIESHALH
jgi:hypothetical protein